MAVRMSESSKSIQNLKEKSRTLKSENEELKKKFRKQEKFSDKIINALQETVKELKNEIRLLQKENAAIAEECHKEIDYSYKLQKEVEELQLKLAITRHQKEAQSRQAEILREYNEKH